MTPTMEVAGGELSFRSRTVWSGLDLRVEPGQFVTVLGPNGSGKSSLLKVVLGVERLTRGRALICGEPVRRGSRRTGYVPQHRGFSADVPLRGADFVQLGIDGPHWGPPSTRRHRDRVRDLLDQVEAGDLARRPLGRMSGGEQQRLRIAQALATDPELLLCDEPLLSLDLRHQQRVVDLVDRRRRDHGTSVLFVTHEINPVLAVTDVVVYLIDGAVRIGTVDEVMRSDVLSALYRSPVEVIRRSGKLVVLGTEDVGPVHHEHSEAV